MNTPNTPEGGQVPPYEYPPPPPKRTRPWLWVLFGVIGLAFVCCVAAVISMMTNNEDSASGRNPTPGVRPTPKSGHGMGTSVRDGKFQFVVEQVRCGVNEVGSGRLSQQAQGQFCLVTLSVDNIGDQPQTMSDINQKGIDSNGSQYGTNSLAGVYVNESNSQVWVTEINPGNQVTGVMVFDIPRDAQLTELELHDSTFSAGVKVDLQ